MIARGNLISLMIEESVSSVGSTGNPRLIGAYQEDEIANKDVNFDLIGRAQFELTDDIGLTATVGWSSNDRKYNKTLA